MARNLFRQLLLTLAFVAAASTLLLGAGAYIVLDRLYEEENEASLGAASAALAASIPEGALPGHSEGNGGLGSVAVTPGAAATARAWIEGAGSAAGWRITLVAIDGTVYADTMADPATMDNHAARPEIAAALAGRTSTAHRRSETLGKELFYAAAPVWRGSGPAIVAVLRLAVDLPALEARLRPWHSLIGLDILVVAVLAMAAAALFSRRISSPLAALAAATRRVAAGERPVAFPAMAGPEEVAVLASGLSSMSAELDRRILQAEAEGREQKAILDGMAEAVLALDHDLRVRMANAAARRLFGEEGTEGETPSALDGLGLLRATRSTGLEEAARDCMASGEVIERELAVYGRDEGWFQAFIAPLAGQGGDAAARNGAVIVLNDITRLRRLERVRRDFVANVSHELRTPIQVIKGFAEALASELAAAPRGSDTPDMAMPLHFVDMVAHNADRMEAIIGDLLTLARLEQDGEGWLQVEDLDIEALLAEARDAVGPGARRRGVAMETGCETGLRARVNGGLFVQAVVNLLDNAVKFSPSGSTVRLTAVALAAAPAAAPQAAANAAWFSVSVADRGPGIPAADLPRIFERFYRVDKARSRDQGGTGLGLAIVRHVVIAHGGLVEAESFEGEGSRFTMLLPADGSVRKGHDGSLALGADLDGKARTRADEDRYSRGQRD